MNEKKYSVKFDKKLVDKFLTSTDLELVKDYKDEHFYDNVYVTRYIDNNPGDLYFFRVPKELQKEEDVEIGESIVGDMQLRDARVSLTAVPTPYQYPYSAMLFLKAYYKNAKNPYDFGSGFMINDSHAATAAHCVLRYISGPENSYPDTTTVYVGRYNDTYPHGDHKVYGITMPNEYFNGADINYDYAILTLNSNP